MMASETDTEEKTHQQIEAVRARLRAGNPLTQEEITNGDWDYMLRKSGLPRSTRDSMSLGLWEQRPGKGLSEALDLTVAMIRGTEEFSILTLAGPPGVGKSHLAIAIAWEWLLHGAWVLFRQSEDLLDEMRQTFDIDKDKAWDLKLPTFANVLKAYKWCHLLVVDDLGLEKPTEWAEARLDGIFNHRWLHRLPTVITTNMPSKDLSPRIVDRIDDKACARVVAMDAPSYRRGRGRGNK